MADLVTGTYGPWYGLITPDTYGGWNIILQADKTSSDTMQTRLVENNGLYPWHANTLRKAKRIAKKEIRGKRQREEAAIVNSQRQIIKVYL